MLITFSGLDGSGKTTLLLEAKKILEQHHRKVSVCTMYDHLTFYALLRRLRDGLKKLLGLPISGNGIPQARPFNLIPNLRQADVTDKSGFFAPRIYRIFRHPAVRRLALFLDLPIFWTYRWVIERWRGHILLMDRYFYDSLADVTDLQNPNFAFVRFFLTFVPSPTLPIFVDISAEKAFERKQEYRVEYLRWRRLVYQNIFSLVSERLVLVNENLEKSCQTLELTILGKINI